MTEKLFKGSCLCGKVTYEVQGPFMIFQYCHCSRCRKFTGSAHASNLFVRPNQFKWVTGEDWVGRFEHPEAKYYATSFCKNCGSSLPWMSQGGKSVIITAGTLDTDPEIRSTQNIFWSSKAPWFDGTEHLNKFDQLPAKK